MKKRLTTAVFLSVLCASFAFAAEMKTYTVGDTGISLNIPSDYRVITSETTIDDPALSALVSALGEKEVQAVLDQNALNKIYLDATPPSLEFEITVTSDFLSEEYTDYSFAALSDAELSQFVSDSLASSGYQIDNYEITQANSTPFLIVDLSSGINTDTASYVRIYQAIKGNKTIVCSLHSLYGTPFSDETYQVMDDLIASITFLGSSTPHNTDALSRAAKITATVISLALIIGVSIYFSKKRKNKRAASNSTPSHSGKN